MKVYVSVYILADAICLLLSLHLDLYLAVWELSNYTVNSLSCLKKKGMSATVGYYYKDIRYDQGTLYHSY